MLLFHQPRLRRPATSPSLLAVLAAATTAPLAFGAAPAGAAPPAATQRLDGPAVAEARFGLGATAAGDIDGDGLGDVLVRYDDAHVDVIYGARGQMSAPQRGGAGTVLDVSGVPRIDAAASRPAGDVDGDGYDDVLVRGATISYVVFGGPRTAAITVGAGAPRTQAILTPAGLNLADIQAAGDFNGDGRSDLVVGRGTSAAVVLGGPRVASLDARGAGARIVQIAGIRRCVVRYLFFQTCSTALRTPVPIGDFNGDGRDDLFQPERSFITLGRAATATINGAGPDALSVAVTNGSYASQAGTRDPQPASFTGVGARPRDLTGDGIDDLVLADAAGGVYTNLVVPGRTSTAAFDVNRSPVVRITSSTLRLAPASAVGDVTGDGRADLLVGGYSGLALTSVPAAPATVNLTAADLLALPPDEGGDGVAIGGDLDGDGLGDLLARYPFRTVDGQPNRGVLYLLTHGPDLRS